ncbi:MAG: VgrG-related protein [Leptolyngbyaceae cyanobacterium SM1_1_3]|nr:VgrG-related protein [Leptolyngbyaceae cyanobacterium SM1_1_3]NJN03581.1 VgrG-related protein [Leptolyngbyaceae cyanobacterium RM1_1_2]NJO12094.1 VgrG-related protein [Leptolyngbyaceae cyanobacterium SL_1_1]
MPVTYIPEVKIEVDGQAAPQSLNENLLQVGIEQSLHLPGMFTLVINNPYFAGQSESDPWEYEGLFQIGKSVKIGFTSSTTESREFEKAEEDWVLEGEITAIESHFTSGSQAPVIVRGYDVSHRLHRGRYNRSFQNMTDTDIVKKITGEVGISTGSIDQSQGPFGYGDVNGSNGYTFQHNQTNMEFMQQLATRNGFELFVQTGKLNFRKPKSDATVDLQWLRNLHSFCVRVTSAEQVNEVEVRGWNYSSKQPIVSTKSKGQALTQNQYGNGSKTSTSFQGKPPTPKMVLVNQPVSESRQADLLAQAICDELASEFVHADAEAEGNPAICPGKTVKLSGMGKYSGEYYVTEARHTYQERVYLTEFSVRGLRGGDLFTLLSGAGSAPQQGPLVGIVTDNKDPQSWGRVRVKFPTLTEEHASYWARVVGAGAGPGRGFDCLPEINDEVLVAFENGDIHRPYVIGGVWNGEDKPSEKADDTIQGGKVRLRTLTTRTGHQLQFIEEDKGSSKAGVHLETAGGHQAYFNDSDRQIKIKSKGGHEVILNDAASKITVSSTGTIEISAPVKITLKVGSSTIELSQTGIEIKGAMTNMQATASASVKGLNVNVEATGPLVVKGLPVKLN